MEPSMYQASELTDEAVDELLAYLLAADDAEPEPELAEAA